MSDTHETEYEIVYLCMFLLMVLMMMMMMIMMMMMMMMKEDHEQAKVKERRTTFPHDVIRLDDEVIEA